MTERIPPEVREAVAALFRKEADAVFRSAWLAAGGDRGEADDAVQEAFQAAALQWATVGSYPPDRQRAWLMRVAINKVIDRQRAARRHRLEAETEPESAQRAPSAEHVALTRVMKDRCLKAISEMPETRRTVAYLAFHEEWTAPEIAEHLGIKPSTVRVHIHHARAMLEAAVGAELPAVQPNDGTDAREETR